MKAERQNSLEVQELELQNLRRELLTDDGELRDLFIPQDSFPFNETLTKIAGRIKTVGRAAFTSLYFLATFEGQAFSETEDLSFSRKTLLRSGLITGMKILFSVYEPGRTYVLMYQALIFSCGAGILPALLTQMGEKKKNS